MKYKYDIISIGDATIDTFLFVEDIKVKKVEEKNVAEISWGDKLPVQKLVKTVAGNAANNAVGSSRLGLKTAFYTVLADDNGGREIVHKMKKDKVALDYIVFDDKHGTNASFVLSHDGERTIFVYHELRNYKLPNFAPSKWVYLTSMAHGCDKIYASLIKYIKTYNVKLGYNPGTFQLRQGVKGNEKLLKHVELLCVNKEEAELWVGQSSDFFELLTKLRKLGPKSVVITDGRRGAYSLSDEGYFYSPEFPGKRIEATGAGDSFATAYIAALAFGLSHEDAICWGPVNAGNVVLNIGPQEGLLTRVELEKRLAKNKKYKAIKINSEEDKSQVAELVSLKKDL